MRPSQTKKSARAELDELRLRLYEAEEALRAIRSGEVDSLLVDGPNGPRVFALEGSNNSYRVLVEAMNNGAATLNEDGVIAYCNGCFARLLEAPLNQVMGASIDDYVPPPARMAFSSLLDHALRTGEGKAEVVLRTAGGRAVPVHLSISVVDEADQKTLCLVAIELGQQKQELDQILSSMTDTVLVFDTEGRITRTNAAAVQMLGFDPAGLDRAQIEQRIVLCSADGTPLPKSDYPSKRALRGQDLTSLPLTLLRGDTSLELSVSCAALRANGNITGAVSVWHNLTPIRRAEHALKDALVRSKRTSAELKAIIEAIPHAVYFGSRDGITRCNPEALRMLGASSSVDLQARITELGGKLQLRDRDSEALIEPAQLPFNRALTGQQASLDLWGTHVDTEQRLLIRSNAAPVVLEGETIGAVAVDIDITDHHRLQATSREREQHYRTLFEVCPSGIVVLDRGGRILEFNERAHCQLGYTFEEFARLELGDIEALESPVEMLSRIEAILRQGAVVFETQQRSKSGAIRDVIVDVRPVEVRGQACLLGVWRDITERKQAEEALRQADRNKNQFIAMLSHELRNPLAPIHNSLYVLDRVPPASEQAERAKQVVKRQVGHMTRLIEDLLDVTRVSRGKIQLHMETVELSSLVRRTVEDFLPSFSSAGVALELRDRGLGVAVRGDRTRLAQVLGNLLHNASKFNQPGGHVVVEVGADVTTGDALVSVADDGAGIAADMVPKLFEPFSQADQTLDRSRGGLGLGLALVKGLVELHGGSVAVESAGLGHGAVFSLRLPPMTARSPAAALPGQPWRRRVLIVEDNVDAVDTLRDGLGMANHEVAVAYNGADAIRQARAFRPDAVLCDVGLPGMSGYEVARILRRTDELARVFLIALGSHSLAEDLRRAREAGFDRHLAKPPSLAEIERLLREHAACPGSPAVDENGAPLPPDELDPSRRP